MTINRINELIENVEKSTLVEKDKKDLLIILKNMALVKKSDEEHVSKNIEFYRSK